MKLRELMEAAKYSQIELVNGHDGRVVAKSRKTLEKYGDVDVLSIYPKIRVNKDGDFAIPYLYVFGSARDIDRIKNGGVGTADCKHEFMWDEQLGEAVCRKCGHVATADNKKAALEYGMAMLRAEEADGNG